jgi:hypothetical protein
VSGLIEATPRFEISANVQASFQTKLLTIAVSDDEQLAAGQISTAVPIDEHAAAPHYGAMQAAGAANTAHHPNNPINAAWQHANRHTASNRNWLTTFNTVIPSRASSRRRV